MWTKAVTAVSVAWALAACASSPPEHTLAGRASSDPLGNEPYVEAKPLHPHHTAGEWAVAVVGTPFYWVFKGAACVGGLAIAAPISAVVALGDHQTRKEGLEILGDGVAQNCGPPYVLTP